MAHNLDMSTGKPAIAYVGKKPWHNLGEELTQNASIEEWIEKAQLGWEIINEPVTYRFGNEYRTMPNRYVLIRSDNGNALSVVSDDYKIVQPKVVLEFYRDLVKDSEFILETAGALDGGRKVWALARSNRSIFVQDNKKDDEKDELNAFLLLATSCDKSLATTTAFTSIRVVCQNTLQFATNEIKGQAPTKYIKVPHNLRFDPSEVKNKLNLIDKSWEKFIKRVRQLAEKEVLNNEAERFFEALFQTTKQSKEKKLSKTAFIEVQKLKSAFQNGLGQSLPTTKNTAWGLVNAVTYYVDHQRKSENQSTRLDSAWFGTGAQLKGKAWNAAVDTYCTSTT